MTQTITQKGYQQIPNYPLKQIADVFGIGYEKHGDIEDLEGRTVDDELMHAKNHIIQWDMGESHDEESDTHHLANAASRLMIALEILWREESTEIAP